MPECSLVPKSLFLVSLLFVALLNPKFNPYLLFKFFIFIITITNGPFRAEFHYTCTDTFQEISHKIFVCGFNLNVQSLFIVIPSMNYVVNKVVNLGTY